MDTICIAGKRPGSNAAWLAGANVIDGCTTAGAWAQALLQASAWSTELSKTKSSA